MANQRISDLGTAPGGALLSDVLPIERSATPPNYSVTAGQIGAIVLPFFNVQSYGAKCDGSTDDSAAVQAAITALPANGGCVVFPAGTTTKITSTLTVSKPNTVLASWGSHEFTTELEASTILDYHGTAGTAINVTGQGFVMRNLGVRCSVITDGQPFIDLNSGYCLFEHCRIYSVDAVNDANFPTRTTTGIKLENGAGSTVQIHHCSICGWGTAIGLTESTDIDSTTIENCIISTNNYGVVVGGAGSGIWIVRNAIFYNYTGNILITGGVVPLSIRDNYFECDSIGGHQSYCVNIDAASSGYVEITGNYIQVQNNNKSPIVITKVTNLVIANNVFNSGQNATLINNVYANAAASIMQFNNSATPAPSAWIDSSVGVTTQLSTAGWVDSATATVDSMLLVFSDQTASIVAHFAETVAGSPTQDIYVPVASEIVADQASSGITAYYGGLFAASVPQTNATNYNNLVGLFGGAIHNGSGTIEGLLSGLTFEAFNALGGAVSGGMYGCYLDVENVANGTITGGAYGVYTYVTNNDVGTVDALYGVYTYVGNAGNGSCPLSYGVFIDTTATAASVGTEYGLWIADRSRVGSLASYQIWSDSTSGGTALHFFGGPTGMGSSTVPNASAQLDIGSTTKGFLPPRMTTAQRNAISSPAEGLMIWNLTTHKLDVYNGSAWQEVTAA